MFGNHKNSLGSSWLSGLSDSGTNTAEEEGATALGDVSSSSSGSAADEVKKPIDRRTVVGSNDEEQPPPVNTTSAGGGGGYVCQPYKVEILDRQLLGNSPGAGRRAAVIETLRQMGIKVFVIDAQNTKQTEEVVQHIRRVVGFVARENSMSAEQASSQRVLFYQDEQGRLFNLILSKHVTGPAGTWKEYLESFSGLEALMALTVLCRSLPCIAENGRLSLRRVSP